MPEKQNYPPDKKYKIGGREFRLKELTLKDDEKLFRKLSEITTDVPVQTNLINETIAITGGFLSSLISSGKTPGIMAMVLEPADGKSNPLFFKRYLRGNTDNKIVAEVLTDFFTEGTLPAASLVNHLMKLLSKRAAQLIESNSNGEDLSSRTRTTTSRK